MPSLCDFSANSGEFAWVDELTQGVKDGDAKSSIDQREDQS